MSVNNGKRWKIHEVMESGTPKVFMHNSPLYDPEKHDLHKLFSKALPRGFAWEVLKVLQGEQLFFINKRLIQDYIPIKA